MLLFPFLSLAPLRFLPLLAWGFLGSVLFFWVPRWLFVLRGCFGCCRLAGSSVARFGCSFLPPPLLFSLLVSFLPLPPFLPLFYCMATCAGDPAPSPVRGCWCFRFGWVVFCFGFSPCPVGFNLHSVNSWVEYPVLKGHSSYSTKTAAFAVSVSLCPSFLPLSLLCVWRPLRLPPLMRLMFPLGTSAECG